MVERGRLELPTLRISGGCSRPTELPLYKWSPATDSNSITFLTEIAYVSVRRPPRLSQGLNGVCIGNLTLILGTTTRCSTIELCTQIFTHKTNISTHNLFMINKSVRLSTLLAGLVIPLSMTEIFTNRTNY